jgi:hypothetical protein
MTNQEYLVAVANALGPLVDEVVFTGGRVVQEYLAIPALREPRVTVDADVIVESATYTEYAAFGERLGEEGFTQSASAGTPPYRWVKDDLVLDVMPLHAEVLGFTNLWYRSGLACTTQVSLTESVTIRILDPPHFLASKLEAYRGRGDDDPYMSHDLEDVVSVVAGRPDCVEEVMAAGPELSDWIGSQMGSIFPSRRRIELVAAHMNPTAPAGLVEIVAERITGLIDCGNAPNT